MLRWLIRRWFPGWALLLCCSCAGSLEAARPKTLGAAEPSARCIDLDERRTTWGAVAKGSAVLAGASGLSMLPLDGDRYETVRIGVAAGGLAAAAVAAGAVYVAEGAGESFVRECSQ